MTTPTQSRARPDAAQTFSCQTRQGSRIRVLGIAKGSDANAEREFDSVWAHRLTDDALRCYYIHELYLNDAGAALSLLPKLDKNAARAALALAKE